MASILVPETGDGLDPTANSYVSLAEAVAYWATTEFDVTTYPTPKVERSLVQATRYIERVYRAYMKGWTIENDQPLSFPRDGIYVVGRCEALPVMPNELKYATFEYAKRYLELEGVLTPDPADRDETGQQLVYTFEKIGPIETKLQYQPSSGGLQVQPYPEADQWMAYLVRSTSGRTIRA